MTKPDRSAAEMVGFDPSALRTHEQYKLLTGTVTPRPIALVTTLGEKGPNAAPFSFFNAIGVKPPMLMISIGPRDGALKDTVRNLQVLPEFVVHMVDHASLEKMNVCAIDFPEQVNEIERAGFRTLPSVKVRPPRLADCPVQFECKVVEIRPVGRLPYHMIIGEIVWFHYRSDLVDERMHVDSARLDPIGRLAGRLNYTRVDSRFSLPALPVPEGDLDPTL